MRLLINLFRTYLFDIIYVTKDDSMASYILIISLTSTEPSITFLAFLTMRYYWFTIESVAVAFPLAVLDCLNICERLKRLGYTINGSEDGLFSF